MLRDSFYKIINKEADAKEVSAEIEFNESHPIFAGHFPGQPIVPGVCMMQIVKDFLQEAVGDTLTLTEGDNIKFLAVIDPRENKTVYVKIGFAKENDRVVANASLFSGSQTFFKLKGTYHS